MSISRVQEKHAYVSDTAVFASNVTAGNLIVVFTGGGDGTDTDSACSDSLGNTYHKLDQLLSPRSNMSVYYAYNITGGACTVTAYSGTLDHGLTAIEYASSNGAFSTDPADDFAIGGAVATVSITTSASGVLVAGWLDEQGDPQTGWTANLTQIQKDAGHIDAQAEGLNKAAGSYTEGITMAYGSASTIVALAGFKEPTGGTLPFYKSDQFTITS